MLLQILKCQLAGARAGCSQSPCWTPLVARPNTLPLVTRQPVLLISHERHCLQ